jgi:hypothetical protein
MGYPNPEDDKTVAPDHKGRVVLENLSCANEFGIYHILWMPGAR